MARRAAGLDEEGLARGGAGGGGLVAGGRQQRGEKKGFFLALILVNGSQSGQRSLGLAPTALAELMETLSGQKLESGSQQ